MSRIILGESGSHAPDRNTVLKIAVITLKNYAHIHHVIPISYELAKHDRVRIDIFTDTAESVRIIRQLGERYSSQCNITQLLPDWLHRFNNWISGSPPRAKHVLCNNKEVFKKYDGIISPDLYTDRLFNEVDRKKTS